MKEIIKRYDEHRRFQRSADKRTFQHVPRQNFTYLPGSKKKPYVILSNVDVPVIVVVIFILYSNYMYKSN